MISVPTVKIDANSGIDLVYSSLAMGAERISLLETRLRQPLISPTSTIISSGTIIKSLGIK